METGFLFRISAFAAESITFCITAAMRIGTGYIDGSCGAFAVLIVGAVVCFAVDVDRFTSASGIYCVHCSPVFLVTEAFAGCIICIAGFGSIYIDGTFGAEGVFVVTAVVGGTF